MARAKKEAALTPEERLQAALVPDWEWPYKLPGNWCWTYLTKAAECLDNFRKPINATERAGRNGNVPYYGATGQVGWIDDFLTDEDLVLLGEDGAPFLDLIKDKAYLITGKAWVNNHAHILRSLFGDTGNRYLLHYLNSFNYAGYVNGTTRLKLTRASMDTIPIPLPPLAEQQRIVDRIESLFSKLDEAKEKAQAVVDSFETRKAAILHKAFTGELTAKWREEHGVGVDSWKCVKFSDVLDVRDGTHDSPTYHDMGYPLITSKNLKDGQITDKDIRYISKEDYEKINERSKVDIGDILFAMIGTIGNPVVVQNEPQFAIKNMALFKNIGRINPYFVKYYLESKTVNDKMQKDAKGSTQKFVSLGYLRAFLIDVPLELEQMEIVHILDNLLAEEQQAKETAEAVLEQIDLMKKSILARAFRGELGTNDPSEESAVELLRQLI